MAGEVYLGDDLDIALGGILHYLGNLFLGVESTVGGLFARTCRVLVTPGLVGAVYVPRAYVVELGVTVNFDAPALVVGQMPMESVEFVSGHEVEVPLDLLDGEEVATDIEVAAPPGEAWIVENSTFGHDDAAVRAVLEIVGQHLNKCLEGVEKACFGIGTYEYAVGVYL